MAALALLALLLGSLLEIKAGSARQSAVAERRLLAAAQADALLGSWWRDPRTFPRSAAGQLGPTAGLAWRTQPVANPPAEQLGAQVIRLEVIDERPGPTLGAVLVTVDVVLGAPRGAPRVGAPGGEG